MTDHVLLAASAPKDARVLAAYYANFLRTDRRKLVFPKSSKDIETATLTSSFVHLHTQDDVVGVMGVFDKGDEWLEVGGAIVTLAGFGFMRLMGRILTVHTYLADPDRLITAVVFAENQKSIDRLEDIGYVRCRKPPDKLEEQCRSNAGSRQFIIFEAKPSAIAAMADNLVKSTKSAVQLVGFRQQPITVGLKHPLLDGLGREGLERLARTHLKPPS